MNVKWLGLVLAVVAASAAGHLTTRANAETVAVVQPTSEEIALALLHKSIDQTKALLASHETQHLEVTNFSGWEANPVLFSTLDAYSLTGDQAWLDTFSALTGEFLGWRSDKRGLVDYAGEVRPQWFRIDKYNIFSVSPFHPYKASEQAEIMKARGWRNLYFSDVDYDGLFLAPMLRFVNIVRENKLHSFDEIADQIITAATETVNSHDSEWVALSDSKGFYTFPKNSPFFLDGVEMPVNEAAIFGTALVEMYVATGDVKYLDRAEAMVNNWLDYVTYGADGVVKQPYATGAWFRGWNEAESPSINTPHAKPNTDPEVFHKASLTIDFLFNLAKYRKSPGITKYLSGFTQLLRKTETITGNQVAFFPRTIAVEMPIDSFHVSNPAALRGYAEISDVTTWERMYLMAYQQMMHGSSDPSDMLLLLANKPDGLPSVPEITTSRLSISPYLIGQNISEGCLYSPTRDSAVWIEFYRASPKHNRLYLSPSHDVLPGIRLDVKGAAHEGTAYLEAGDCVNWQWVLTGTAEHSQPATPKENQVKMTVYSVAD